MRDTRDTKRIAYTDGQAAMARWRRKRIRLNSLILNPAKIVYHQRSLVPRVKELYMRISHYHLHFFASLSVVCMVGLPPSVEPDGFGNIVDEMKGVAVKLLQIE
jgi:hypothetical protein